MSPTTNRTERLRNLRAASLIEARIARRGGRPHDAHRFVAVARRAHSCLMGRVA